MRSEVQTIKNLLLNRSQFPSIPTTSPILPSWQLESKNVIISNFEIVDLISILFLMLFLRL